MGADSPRAGLADAELSRKTYHSIRDPEHNSTFLDSYSLFFALRLGYRMQSLKQKRFCKSRAHTSVLVGGSTEGIAIIGVSLQNKINSS